MSLPMASSPEPDAEPFVELDPSGRYGRYRDLLGTGSTKRVYRGFDQENGLEIAWNQVLLRTLGGNSAAIARQSTEIRLLRTIHHPSIISLYHVWFDKEVNSLNFITKACISGNLRDYRKRHRRVSVKAIKKWSRQILVGIQHLHSHHIIHRDINCSNVFMNGDVGQVKIGDLGNAAVTVGAAHSMLGTPEFMAPEIYDEDYTELVDIYSFGMTVFELVANEIPYSECNTIIEIYTKVMAGVRPEALDRVENQEVMVFIERCLGRPRERRSAEELLRDPFFSGIGDPETTHVQ